jgi:AAA family ATP:ADP antiporter
MSERQPRGGNPALALVERLVDVRTGELLPLALAFMYHFCLLCGYYAVRPLRDTFGIERGADALPWLYTGTAVFSLLLHPLFTRAVSKWPRRKFIPWTYHFFAINLVVFFALLVTVKPRALFTLGSGESAVNIGSIEAIGYVFFVWLSVFNVFITSVFWSFMTDLFTPEQGKRMFGVMAAGGSVGAIAGGATAWQLTDALGRYAMILIAVALIELCVVFVWLLSRIMDRPRTLADAVATERREEGGRAVGGGVLDGFLHVVRSPYLAGIAGVMLLMTVCNTYLYTQQAEIVEGAFASRDDRTAFFGMLDMLTNTATLLLQFFLVGRLMKYVGVLVTLVVLPIIFFVSFTALAQKAALADMGVPLLTLLGVVMVATRAGRYAIMRPAREVLYTVVSRSDKYKAKNFNDTFVYRGGDFVAIWSDKAMRVLEMTNAGIAWVGAGVALVMGGAGVALGLEQKRRNDAIDAG